MAISVVMPALEMAQETGKLLAWRKNEGEQVTKGEPLLEIETDKAVVEVEAPADGLLAGVTAKIGDEIPVGQTIAWLVKPGEQPPTATQTQSPSARATTAPDRVSSAAPPAAEGRAAVAPQISPKARRLAKELGVDISQIRGTGPDGTISSEDVQAASSKKNAAPAAPATTEPLSQVARLMAERTTQSWTSVPHFFLAQSVDAGALIDTQKKLNTGSAAGSAPTITDLLIGLLARVLVKHPRMNSSWTGDGIRANADINISVAMAVKDGVVGAVIPQANQKDIAAISVLRRELTRARKSRAAASCRYRGRYIYTEQSGDVQGGRVQRDHHAAAVRGSCGGRNCRCGGAGRREAGHPADDDHDDFQRSSRRGRRARRGISWRSGERHSRTGKLVVTERLQ